MVGLPAGGPQTFSLGPGALDGVGSLSFGGSAEGGAAEGRSFGWSSLRRAGVHGPGFRGARHPVACPQAAFSGQTLWMTAGVIGAVPVVGELAWWKGNEKGDFHFTDEGWFAQDTYAGGADKASHFFFGYMASREMEKWYERFGNTRAAPPARLPSGWRLSEAP